MKEYIGDQGEISIFKIAELPNVKLAAVERVDNGSIVSHSESGSNHLLERSDVLERVDVASGMRVLYAIVENPDRLYQDAGDAHGAYDLAPGIYEFRIAREYDPFLQQARIVAD